MYEKLLFPLILAVVGGLFTIVLWPVLKKIIDTWLDRGKPPKGRSVDLVGRWTGELGWIFDLKGHLRCNPPEIQGQFEWTLLEFPPDAKWAKKYVSRTATEFVKGYPTAEGFALSGQKVDNEDMLACSDYTFQINEAKGSFTATTVARKNAEKGTATGSVAIS